MTLQVNDLMFSYLRLIFRQNYCNQAKLAMAYSDIMLLWLAVNEFLWAFRKALRLGATDPEC
jgi:hypothetical protein